MPPNCVPEFGNYLVNIVLNVFTSLQADCLSVFLDAHICVDFQAELSSLSYENAATELSLRCHTHSFNQLFSFTSWLWMHADDPV